MKTKMIVERELSKFEEEMNKFDSEHNCKFTQYQPVFSGVAQRIIYTAMVFYED